MALTPCSVETDVISQLPDKPVTDGGLTSAQFKAKFDQVGLAIKTFINQTLIPQITAQFEEKLTTGSLSGTVLINHTITTSKLYDGCVTAAKLDYQAVTSEKVASGAITAAKLANDVYSALLGKVASITLSDDWTAQTDDWTQTVTLTGATPTANSKIDLQADSTAISQMIEDGCAAIYIENNNGTLTAHAVGAPTTEPLTIQCTVTEVTA